MPGSRLIQVFRLICDSIAAEIKLKRTCPRDQCLYSLCLAFNISMRVIDVNVMRMPTFFMLSCDFDVAFCRCLNWNAMPLSGQSAVRSELCEAEIFMCIYRKNKCCRNTVYLFRIVFFLSFNILIWKQFMRFSSVSFVKYKYMYSFSSSFLEFIHLTVVVSFEQKFKIIIATFQNRTKY